MEEFTVAFDNPRGVYFAGQVVTGKVILRLSKPTKFKEILFEVNGRSFLQFSKRSKTQYNTINLFVTTDNLLAYAIKFLESDGGKTRTQQPGLYYFPFSFQLDPGLPTTFEGRHGHVRYIAKATVVKMFNKVVEQSLTVISLQSLDQTLSVLDNNRFIQLNCALLVFKRVSLNETKTISCCGCLSGTVEAEFTADKSLYAPGETMNIKGVVKNNSNTNINLVEIGLKQRETYYGFQNGIPVDSCETSRIIVSGTRPGIDAGAVDVCDNFQLVLPQILPQSWFPGCRSIDLKYELEIILYINFNTITMKEPILIGSSLLWQLLKNELTARSPSPSPVLHQPRPLNSVSLGSAQTNQTTSPSIQSQRLPVLNQPAPDSFRSPQNVMARQSLSQATFLSYLENANQAYDGNDCSNIDHSDPQMGTDLKQLISKEPSTETTSKA